MNYAAAAFATFTILLSQPARAGESAKEFFDKYFRYSDSSDLSALDRYADSAKVHTYRRYPHGLVRHAVVSGAQWKQMAIATLPLSVITDDRSIYSKISISKHGHSYKIKANRYSTRKCYTDTGYYMIVEPDRLGKLQIIEEYFETQPQSDC